MQGHLGLAWSAGIPKLGDPYYTSKHLIWMFVELQFVWSILHSEWQGFLYIILFLNWNTLWCVDM